jgi:hypothetical protein
MSLTTRIVPAAVAGSLLLGGASGVFAAKSHAHRVTRAAIAGQVSNVSATGFTLTWTPKHGKNDVAPVTHSVQVATSTTTVERARKGTTGTLANGDFAVVLGTRARGAVTAKRVLFATAPFKIRLHVAIGTVAAGTSATSLVITTRAGKTRTLAITASTKFFQGKVAATAPLALTAGEKVLVRVARDATVKGQLDATVIRVRAVKP